MRDLRVSFRYGPGTFLDAVWCTDLYADLIEQAETSTSAFTKTIAEFFTDEDSNPYICPNVTSFDFLSENITMNTLIDPCKRGVQNVYAGNEACNE